MKRWALRAKNDGEPPHDVVDGRQNPKRQDSGSEEDEKAVVVRHETA